MKTSQDYKEDALRNYINPRSVEKAPEGFTSKVMSGLLMEPVPVKTRESLWKRNYVPIVSAAVVFVLVALALLLPDKNSSWLPVSFADFLKHIYGSVEKLELSSARKINIPATLVYISVAVFMLSFFDRMLYLLFHRDRE